MVTNSAGTAPTMTRSTMGTSHVSGTSDTGGDLVPAAVSVRDMGSVPARLERRVTQGFWTARNNSGRAAIWSLESIGMQRIY